jgi:hypothetical protein
MAGSGRPMDGAGPLGDCATTYVGASTSTATKSDRSMCVVYLAAAHLSSGSLADEFELLVLARARVVAPDLLRPIPDQPASLLQGV